MGNGRLRRAGVKSRSRSKRLCERDDKIIPCAEDSATLRYPWPAFQPSTVKVALGEVAWQTGVIHVIAR